MKNKPLGASAKRAKNCHRNFIISKALPSIPNKIQQKRTASCHLSEIVFYFICRSINSRKSIPSLPRSYYSNCSTMNCPQVAAKAVDLDEEQGDRVFKIFCF